VIELAIKFWKPIAAIVGVLILLASFFALKHSYDEGRRDEGRAEVQAKFDAYVNESRERSSALALQWDQQRQAAEAGPKGTGR
jgi:hypothetical protein